MMYIYKIKSLCVLVLLVFVYQELSSQRLIHLGDTSSHHFSGSYLVNDDTLEVNYISGMYHQNYNRNVKSFNKTTIVNSNLLKVENQQSIDSNFFCYKNFKIEIDSSHYIEIGDFHESGLGSKGYLWIKNNKIAVDSIVAKPFYDSTFKLTTIQGYIVIKNQLYLYGEYDFESYPYYKAFIIKYNINNNQWVFNSYYCYAPFCYITRLLYDKVNNNFIAISTARLGNTIAPNGAGIAKIDTNLNLVPNTAHAMEVHHNYYSWDTGYYNYAADIAWVTDSTFLAAGTVTNPRQFPSQTPNPNPAYHNDIAVALRSSDSLKEINDPKKFGKVDTSERTEPTGFILEKIDSNLFVAVTNSRYYNYMPEPWNTSLALFGLDANGDKHWEYYMPYKDYCWAKEVHPTSKGGLWVTAQCSGDLNRQAGTYEYFVKVAYIDSIAHWPRKPSTVGVNEIQKKAKEFVVYPNPTNNNLKIKQYGLITELNYELYDQSGRLVKSQKSAEHQVELNLQDLAKGFYILRITDRNGKLIKTEKVVRQ